MELGSSRTSVNTDDDYSLITYEKCNPPRAKLFIVFLASLVVATIIVLLVVLTRLKPLKSVNNKDPDVQCPDIAIIGGGLAGTYAAWRLREINQSIVLYEKSARLGGRFYTHHVTGTEYRHPRELGASMFLPSLHPILNNLVEELGLDTEWFVYGDRKKSFEYIRGQFIEYGALCQQTCPYRLDDVEVNRSPRELLRLENVLLQSGSYEAYNYLRDTLYWWEYYPDGNSQAFLDYVTENSQSESYMAEAVTIQGGMDRLIEELVARTKESNKRFRVFYNSSLVDIDSQPDYNYLRIQQPGGATETSPSCARHVILALSPEEILELGFSLAPLSDIWRPQFEMLSRISLMRVLVEIGHDESLFPKGSPSWTSLRTDLPIQNVHVIESSRNMEQSTPDYGDRDNTTWSTDNDTSLSAYTTTIQINIYRDHLDYWTGLLTADGYSFAHAERHRHRRHIVAIRSSISSLSD
ncbi:hypothetical protein LSH36_346g01008 [Paralvinella palmiformis]|uniref:Amine oxidase domain-containing protein n=1 Tax=Paralvinella palmiformis TaxID=53620 RepID=A0AAD9JGC1_9ANNE|nr:hypothetical protein LSH36_346g01008 [Paralvinella palmiformis]